MIYGIMTMVDGNPFVHITESEKKAMQILADWSCEYEIEGKIDSFEELVNGIYDAKNKLGYWINDDYFTITEYDAHSKEEQAEPKSKVKHICNKCGHDHVFEDARVLWNYETQKYDVELIYDGGHICTYCRNDDCSIEYVFE